MPAAAREARMWNVIPTLVSAGAIGVAIAMLFLSHKQFSDLVELLKADHKESTENVHILATESRDYRRYALVAVVLSIVVQPADGLPPNVMPTVRHAGVVLKPRVVGEFDGLALHQHRAARPRARGVRDGQPARQRAGDAQPCRAGRGGSEVEEVAYRRIACTIWCTSCVITARNPTSAT
jgi:hypothetical protein